MPTRPTRTRRPPASYWRPARQFVEEHRAQIAGYRVDAVSTWGHWEGLLRGKVASAAGARVVPQEDFPQDGSLYNDEMTPAMLRAWMRSLGVRYVMLPDAPLDYSLRARG
jgi:hypothetical protein